MKIIGELRKNGKTIILITHKIEEIKKIADRCAVLHRGKLVDVLDVASTSSQTMANMMGAARWSFLLISPLRTIGTPSWR